MKGSVQQKIPCVFKIKVQEEPSEKRKFQSYSVTASEEIREDVDIANAFPSEKVDGTCCYVSKYCGRPWLWARHDRKPSKSAEKRFKKFRSEHMSWRVHGCSGNEPTFEWDVVKDFKEVPSNWIPALDVPKIDNIPQPDENGHTPGWVPVDPASRSHCWHNSVVDFETGIALVLRNQEGNTESKELEFTVVSLTELLGTTSELVGTNINGNPYKLGSKNDPVHALVPHGSIGFSQSPPGNFYKLTDWFDSEADGKVEGVVWNSQGRRLFKVHRHHLKLKWPISETRLSSMPVTVNVDLVSFEKEWNQKSLFYKLNTINNKNFKQLRNLSFTPKETSDVGGCLAESVT